MECRYRRKGVTLLEAVGVMAVIGVLTAVLLPAFAGPQERSREAARRSSCQNNLKELAVVLQVYWNDYDCVLPSSALVSHSKKWNKTDFIKFATQVGKTPVNRGKRQTFNEVMSDYMKNKDIIFCPSDPSEHKSAVAQTSYWWKLAIDKAWYGDGCKPCRKEGDFCYNSDQIIFYEHESWHSSERNGLVNGAQINVVYLDTHVRNVTLKNATSGDPKNCAANADGEPMWFNYNLEDAKRLSNSSVPAKFVDPHVNGDDL